MKSPGKLNLPWKVLDKHSKALKSPWILPITGGFNTVFEDRPAMTIAVDLGRKATKPTVFEDLNQYKIMVPLFGAAYAAPNKGTIILY